MAAVLTKSETSTDSKGREITSETWEAFDAPPSAPSGAKNSKLTHTDGKYTLVFDTAPTETNPGDEYSVEGSMSQEPIETHEKFQGIAAADWKKWNLWKNNSKDEELAGWKPDSGALADLAALYEKGVTDYLVPRAVVRITRIEGSSPRLSRLGKIDAPSGAPTLPSGANWMLTGASGNRQQDGKWSNSYEYMSSGPAGWNSDIYS
ncbi:MAG: hypothetical protein WCS65_12365 [Verrucomicrobiae bacterium]